jgi:hypothetical protein
MYLKSFRQFVVGLVIAIPCVLGHSSSVHAEEDSLRTSGVVPLSAAAAYAIAPGGAGEQTGTSLGDLQLRYLQSAAGAGARFSQSPLMPQYPGSDVRGPNGEALPGFVDGGKIRNMAAYSLQPPIPSAAIRYQTASQADEQEMYRGAPPMTGAPLTDSACYILMMKAMDTGLAKMSEPQRVTAAAQAAGMAQAINLGNAASECARQQASTAIDYCQKSMQNFTVDPNNKWNQLRNNIFVPMGLLLLLPGAVLAQVKAIASAGSPVLGDCNPFEGILRAIVAVFLIPATYLVLNYGIDVSNSINQSINGGYQGIAGGDMYAEATAAQVRANPVRQPSENRNALDQPTAQMTPLLHGTTPFARYEGAMLENSIEDPSAKVKQAPPERTDEALSSGAVASRLMMSASNAGLTGIWNILCAFQTAYMYYLWFVGPVVAGLWVWPIKSLRQALPNWIEGVITLCFWSLFWNTVIMLMACFRGTDETGSVMNTALNFLATASVQYAFDFAGLVKAAGQEAAGMAMGAAQKAAQSSQGKKGGGGLLGGITSGIGGAAGGLLGGLGGAASGLLGGVGLGAVGKEVGGLLTAGGAAVGMVAAEAGAVVGAGASLATGIAQVSNLGGQVSSFMGNLSNAISTAAGGLVSDMSDIATPPLSAISSTVNGVAGGISAALEVGMPPLQGEIGAVAGAAVGVVGGVAGAINGVETGIVGGITSAINGVETGIVGGVMGAANGVETGIAGGVISAVNGAETGMMGGVRGAISGTETGGIVSAVSAAEGGLASGSPVKPTSQPAVADALAPYSQPTAPDAPAPYRQPPVPDAPAPYSQPAAPDAPAAYSQPTAPEAPAAYSQPTAPDAPAAYSQPAAPDASAAYSQPAAPAAPSAYSQPTAPDAPSGESSARAEQSNASGAQEHPLDLDKIAAESARHWNSITPDQQREQTARDDARFTEWQNTTPDGQAWKQQQDQQQHALADIDSKHQADDRAEAQRVASSPEGQAAAAQEQQQHQAYVDQMSGHQHADHPLYRGIHFNADLPSAASDAGAGTSHASTESQPAQPAPPTVPPLAPASVTPPAPAPFPAPAAGNEVLNSWFN